MKFKLINKMIIFFGGFPKEKLSIHYYSRQNTFVWQPQVFQAKGFFFKCMKHFDQKPASLGTECVNELVCLHYVYQTFYD